MNLIGSSDDKKARVVARLLHQFLTGCMDIPTYSAARDFFGGNEELARLERIAYQSGYIGIALDLGTPRCP